AAGVLPQGALNLLVGGAGDLLAHVGPDDAVAFTGSAGTAARVRGHPNMIARNVPVNIEADSINAAVLASDAADGGAVFDAFVKEVVREMTVKAGQKCTAIRRVFVPAARAEQTTQALAARLAKVVVGDPRREEVRMGPVVTRAQQQATLQAIRVIAKEAAFVCGGDDAPAPNGVDPARSCFVAPTLLKVENSAHAQAVHDTEVFGPAASVLAYRDEDEAFRLIARGGGSLVA